MFETFQYSQCGLLPWRFQQPHWYVQDLFLCPFSLTLPRWIKQLENKLAPTVEEIFLIQNSDLKNPLPWIFFSVGVLTVRQIYTEESKVSYALTQIPSISLVLTRMGTRLTGLSAPLLGWTIIQLTKRKKGKSNSIVLLRCTFFYFTTLYPPDNSMNKCYALRLSVKHTHSSQQKEIHLHGIKSYSIVTDLHSFKLSDPSW